MSGVWLLNGLLVGGNRKNVVRFYEALIGLLPSFAGKEHTKEVVDLPS